MRLKMKYVLGFVFIGNDKILLQLKNRGGDYLNGKLNGLGGKIEEGESAISAMAREYFEETGDNRYLDWHKFSCIFYKNGVELNVFTCNVSDDFYDNIEWSSEDSNAEKLFIFDLNEIDWKLCVSNLEHIIKLILL